MIMLLDVSQSNHLDIDITLHLNSRTDSLPTRFVKNQTQAVTRLGRPAGHVASHSKARNHTREQVYGYHAYSLFQIMYGKDITSTKTKPCKKKELKKQKKIRIIQEPGLLQERDASVLRI